MRFTEADTKSSRHMEFIPRQRQNEVWRIIGAFVLAVAILGMLVLAPGSADYKNLGAIVSIVVVMILGLFIVFEKQRAIDDVMSTEFQNLLFSQAACLGVSFCLFVRRDGAIVYANDGLRKVFKNFIYSDAMALEGLFTEVGVAKADRERIMNALYSDTTDRLIFPIPDESGTEQTYVLTVEPLQRPGGFSVVRGRQYRTQRAGEQPMPEQLRTVTGEKLDHMLHHSRTAHFVTDPYGRFEYITPAFENMLGYSTEEAIAQRLSLQNILVQMRGAPVPDDYKIGEFHDIALVRKKTGVLMEVMLDISMMRDPNGKLLATSGSLQPYGKLV